MKTTLFAASFLIFAFSAQAAVSPMKDPRKCPIPAGQTTSGESPQTCAEYQAERALGVVVARAAGPSEAVNLYCKPRTVNLLVWSCVYGHAGKTATVTFRALSTGWHTRVQTIG